MIIHLIAPKDLSQWPKIWHHCYSIFQTLPYQIKLWNDEDIDNLLIEDDQDFFGIINQLPLIYKLDYVRYIILEKFGGAYFDLDVEIINDFIPSLNPNKIYLAEGHWNCAISNHIMISPPLEVVWNSVKNKTKQNIIKNQSKCKSNPNFTLNTVGPIALSEWFLRWYKVDFHYLSYYHFSWVDSDVCYSKHHCTSNWV